MGRETRRLLVVLVAGLLFSAGGALWLGRGEQGARAAVQDNPLAALAVTSTSTVDRPTSSAPRPVDPPRDEYAPEPVREIGVIEIPKIGLRHRVFHGITLRNIDLGPSHWPGSAFPGETGNAVFAGHRVTHTHPFRNIHRLVAGDEVHFDIGGVRTVYLVTESFVVTPRQVDPVIRQTSTPTATLFACHPPGSARQRYVVRLGLRAD